MGLWVPAGAGNYAWHVDSIGTTRPAVGMGATVTPGNNVKGSYAQVFTALAQDCYFLAVCINNATATLVVNTIVDIGVDPAGGTAYSVVIPDLLAPGAADTLGLSATAGGGIWYYFPLWLKAGSTVAARAAINNATPGTVRVRGLVFGKPRDRRLVRVGTKVTAYGIVAATSQGTAITSGTTAEGAWTSLGAITSAAWWWQAGFGCGDSTMAAVGYFMDLGIGDASNKRVVIENDLVITSASERTARPGAAIGCEHMARASGDTVYGRLQCSGTADATLSMAAYGLGG